MPVDLTDMRLFVRIGELKNLTQAARFSYMTGSGASMRIKNVEQRLGVQLLFRTTQGVTLTPAGETFLRYSQMALREAERFDNEIKEYTKGTKGHLRVFANTSSMQFLPPAFTVFLAAHPAVNIDIKEYGSQEIIEAVRDGRADIGVFAGELDASDLQVWPYREDRMVLATSPGHPFANRRSIGFAQTLSLDYIGLPEHRAMQRFIYEAARKERTPLNIRVQAKDFRSMCQLIAAGVGVGVLPESVARHYGRGLKICLVKLTDDWATRKSYICTRSLELLPPFAKELIDALRQSPARTSAPGTAVPSVTPVGGRRRRRGIG